MFGKKTDSSPAKSASSPPKPEAKKPEEKKVAPKPEKKESPKAEEKKTEASEAPKKDAAHDPFASEKEEAVEKGKDKGGPDSLAELRMQRSRNRIWLDLRDGIDLKALA